MAELPEKYEVIMEIGFACTNGTEFIVANAKKVGDIVRCRDCKFWGENLTEKERNECDVYADLVCTYWMSDGLTRDDFCSHGEREDDG